ncbi:MAG: transketolase [archaeon]
MYIQYHRYKFKGKFSWENMNQELRIKIAELAYDFNEGHIPSAFSIIDILSALYGSFLKYDSKNPEWEDRDYFIQSKGHGCMALYVILEKYGFIDKERLSSNCIGERILGGHPDWTKVPGVEASTGSLGNGIGYAAGVALGLKIKKKRNKVITLIGDGESNEGTVWETALLAPNLKLGNLCVIVDNNKSAVSPVPDMKKKWEAFGWETYEVDGHSEQEILRALNNISFDYDSRPKVIIANTVKGKGVSFMENNGAWHSKVPNEPELHEIKQELLNGN